MRIIIDTNIIIAALIKDSTNRHLIFALASYLYYPESMLEEIVKYKEIIKKKGKMNEDDFWTILRLLVRNITLLSNEEIKQHAEMANDLMGKIDPDDRALIAAAFLFDDAIIWSNDPHLKQQKEINTLTTSELISFLH